MKKAFDIIRQPHPAHDDPGRYFRLVTSITILVFLLIVVLKPFRYNTLSGLKLVSTAGIYVGAGYACMIINFCWVLLFPRFFSQTNWTLGREFLMLTYQISSIAATVFLVSQVGDFWPERKLDYLKAWTIVATGGILPYGLATMAKHIYLLNKTLRQEKLINGYIERKHVAAANEGSEHLVFGIGEDVLLDDLLFVESRGNYLHIFYKQGWQIGNCTVRMTLNDFEAHNRQYESLFRSHRGFVVNLANVKKVMGNAAGYQLLLDEQLSHAYVSRNRIAAFKSKMEDLGSISI